MENEITETYGIEVSCDTCNNKKHPLGYDTCLKPQCENWALWEPKAIEVIKHAE